MQYIYSQNYLSSNQHVRVNLDTQVNVRLMDSHNYNKYKKEEQYTYYGGLAKKTTVEIKPPYPGTWFVVLDQRGLQPKQYKYGIQVVSSN